VKLSLAVSQQIDGLIQGGQALTRAGIQGGISNTNGDILLFPGAKTTSWLAGATIPLGGNASVFGSFQQSRPSGSLSERGADALQNITSVGYSYSLSKRTSFYAYFSYATGYLYIAESNVSTVGTGIVHRF